VSVSLPEVAAGMALHTTMVMDTNLLTGMGKDTDRTHGTARRTSPDQACK
jgi:hypothetical protein